MAFNIDEHITNIEECIKKQKIDMGRTSSLIEIMRNELEIEKAKENLLLSELRGSFIQVNDLIMKTHESENNDLKTLLVQQLSMANKEELLENINNQFFKEQSSFIKEVLEKPEKRPICQINSSEDIINTKKIKLDDDCLKGMNKLKSKPAIEEGIAIIKDKIHQATKEYEHFIQCLAEHQDVLKEINSHQEYTDDDYKTIHCESDIEVNSLQEIENTQRKLLKEQLLSTNCTTEADDNDVSSSSRELPSSLTDTETVKTVINTNKLDLYYKMPSRATATEDPNKKNIQLVNQLKELPVKPDVQIRRNIPAFKPKTPSCLRKKI